MIDSQTKRLIAEKAARNSFSTIDSTNIDEQQSLPAPHKDEDGNFIYTYTGENDHGRKQTLTFVFLLVGIGTILGSLSLFEAAHPISITTILFFMIGCFLFFFGLFINKSNRSFASGVVKKKSYFRDRSKYSFGRYFYEITLENSWRKYRINQAMFHVVDLGTSVKIAYDPFTKSVLEMTILSPVELQPKTHQEILIIEDQLLKKNFF